MDADTDFLSELLAIAAEEDATAVHATPAKQRTVYTCARCGGHHVRDASKLPHRRDGRIEYRGECLDCKCTVWLARSIEIV